MKEIKESQTNCGIVIVGNKLDVKKNDINQIAKNNGCQFYQISTKTG
jgi:hypothetical protein